MNVLWGAIQAILLCAAALGYGGLASPFIKDGRPGALGTIVRGSLGLGFLVLATAAGGWLRIWGPGFHAALLTGGLVPLAVSLSRSSARRALPRPGWRLGWTLPAFALLFFYAAFPPTFYDALLYHLGLPGYYLQAGGFAPWPENLFSALPQNAEMLNLLLLSGGSVHGPKFLSLALALALCAGLADWGRASGLARPWLPALFFIAIPEVAFLAATEKNDMLLMLFLLLGARQLALLHADPGDRRACVLAGVFLGLSAGVKWQGLIYGAAFVAAYVMASRAAWSRRLRQAALIAIIVILLISPWLARNQAVFANPFHPYLGKVFAQDAAAQAQQILEGVRRGQGFTPRAILAFFGQMFFRPYSLGVTHVTGVLILLLLPLLAFSGGLPSRAFLLAGIGAGLVLLLAVARVPRYFLPLFMVLALPLASGWEGFLRRLPRFRRLIVALTAALVLVQCIQAVSLLERMTLGARYLQGKMRGDLPASARYLDIIPYYRAASFINSRLDAGTLTAFIGEERTFYVNRPFLAGSFYDRQPALEGLPSAPDAAAWAGTLRRRHVTHVLYCPSGLGRRRGTPSRRGIPAGEQQRLEAYLSSWTKLYDDGRYSLFRLPR